MNKSKQRYNLNYRIRKQGFELRGKTILLPADKEPTKQVVKLQNEFHYSIQHTIV